MPSGGRRFWPSRRSPRRPSACRCARCAPKNARLPAKRVQRTCKTSQYRLECCRALSRCASAGLELDPAFVEAVQHVDAGQRVGHTLRAEQRCPGRTPHRPGHNIAPKNPAQCVEASTCGVIRTGPSSSTTQRPPSCLAASAPRWRPRLPSRPSAPACPAAGESSTRHQASERRRYPRQRSPWTTQGAGRRPAWSARQRRAPSSATASADCLPPPGRRWSTGPPPAGAGPSATPRPAPRCVPAFRHRPPTGRTPEATARISLLQRQKRCPAPPRHPWTRALSHGRYQHAAARRYRRHGGGRRRGKLRTRR